jgi:hypothetical protein
MKNNIIMVALLVATSTTTMASSNNVSSNEFSQSMRQLSAHEDFEVGYFLDKKNPYILYKGLQVDVNKAIDLHKSEKEKEHKNWIAAKKIEKAIIKENELIALNKNSLISQTFKNGIKIGDLDKIDYLDTPFSYLSNSQKYKLADSYILRVSNVKENGSEINHLADITLSGEVSHATYGKDQYNQNKTVKLSALFDFEKSNLRHFTINVDHKGLWVMKDSKVPDYSQRLYALNGDLPQEKSTLNLAPGENVETYSVERQSIIYSLIKK